MIRQWPGTTHPQPDTYVLAKCGHIYRGTYQEWYTVLEYYYDENSWVDAALRERYPDAEILKWVYVEEALDER